MCYDIKPSIKTEEIMDKKFIEGRREHLLHRKKSKKAILKRNGEQALSHSYADIARIDFALKRIETNQYGLCTNCGMPIPKPRLLIIPETPFCVSCAKQKCS
jgi:RNA polymerase-binding transcription factor DksA